MMESNGEGGDDPASGWLQVKKKHRSSSKFSLHGRVGGFTAKQSSNVLPSQPYMKAKSGNSNDQCSGPPLEGREDFIENHSVVSNEDEMGVHYLDKRVVSQDNECSISSVAESLSFTDADCKIGDDQALPQKDNPGVLPKIKWGDLDDGALILHNANKVAEIRFGAINGNDNLIFRKSENADGSVSCTSFCTEPEDNKLAVPSIDANHFLQEALSSSQRSQSLKLNCKEVNEVSLKDAEVRIAEENIVTPVGEDVICPATEEAEMMVELSTSPVICETDDPEALEVPVIDGPHNSEIVLDEKSGLATPEEFSMAASVEDCVGQQAESILDELSKAHIMSAIGAGDAGESKERFRQRLWCFLFENLNRAIDELYLLCELECDLEQMKEAILVLEEAASDFKELNSRVEEFENVRRSSSKLSDGTPITIKSDLRRPHALSWEVRRMTTSPHRAEILSSSLEAFRKIQQERASMHAANGGKQGSDGSNRHRKTHDSLDKHTSKGNIMPNAKESVVKLRKQSGVLDPTQGNLSRDKRSIDTGRSNKINSVQNGRISLQNQSTSDLNPSRVSLKDSSVVTATGKSKKELLGSTCEMEKVLHKREKMLTESIVERNSKSVDNVKRQIPLSERDKERRNGPNEASWRSMDAWKEKRNWEELLASPFRVSSRFSHSPGMSRKSAERARILRDKLMSPEKKKKTSLDLKKEAEEKHARATRIRNELEIERVQKLQRTSEKLNRVNEWQAVRSMKLREGMHARHQRSEFRHEAFLAQVVRRAGDESSKVNEVRFITSLNEENKKIILRQKLQDSELRRAEKLQVMKIKQKEDVAREEAVLERKKLIEAEKLQRLAETQRKKEEAQVRREEERKASSAAREAKAIEQMRRKEVRAKAQQEEAELLAQKLAERLSESEQRRKFYLEQIRERASMDFRDQSSPLQRRSFNNAGQGRSTPTNNGEDDQGNNASGSGGSIMQTGNAALQHTLKRRIKKIRQRLMALKYDFLEPSVGPETAGIGYRAAVGTARAKIGRWLQELQRLRQARKEGAANIGLITAEMIKFLEGKDPELQASRQAGLLDFIASALPASHTSKPEACQVTLYLLRLLRVVLSVHANKSYFLAQNLLPPIIPMLAAALENYIKIAASSGAPGPSNLLSSGTSIENLKSISEVLDGFLWTVATIIGHTSVDERQLQMQDGLLELVISYQVIHRLRDLFALYDRPQVEGSPFPSSILLSINLLAILTSRFRIISSIDWESFPVEIMIGNEIQEAILIESADFGGSSLYNCSGDGSVAVPLPDVPEDRPLDELCKRRNDTSVFIDKNADKAADVSDETQGIRKDEMGRFSVSKKAEKNSVDNGVEQKSENKLGLKQPVAFLLSVISETGLVCLPSLLTAVLLQANNRLSSEPVPYVLPSNFEEVATGVLKVLNNLALIDINFIQRMLARADLKMELFHLMSFLLSHCTSKWGVASDQIGLLLLESLLLLGYFALFHPENQAVLRWGKSPTILHKVCDLPFVFFSDPELMPILAGTLVAACFGCEQNKGVVQQELSTDMLLSLIRSCRNVLPAFRSVDNPPTDEYTECDLLVGPESKKLQVDTPQKSNRCNVRSVRAPSGKISALGSNNRALKLRTQKESKAMKLCEEMSLKHNLFASETSSNLMLHSRFPQTFIHKAEQFFSSDITSF